MRTPFGSRTGLFALCLVCLLPALARAEGAVGRVTFVGTLGEEGMPDGSVQARFRFRLSESSCGTTEGVWMRRRSGSNWGDWEPLPPAPVPIRSDPAAVVRGQNTIELFAQGSDNHIYWTTWNGTQWSGWTVVPGPQTFSSGPAVASRGASSLDLFARNAADTALWRNVWNGTSWQGWAATLTTPIPISSNPEAVARSATRVDVFARQFDNTMRQIIWTGTFGAWSTAGIGLFNGGAAVVSELSQTVDRMELFARGTDDAVYRSLWNGTTWSGWFQVAGADRVASDPAAVSVGTQTEVFATKADGRMSTIAVPGAAAVWTPLGNQWFTGGPAAVSFAGRVHLFARGSARAERWVVVRSGKTDGGSEHNAVNFRNAYNTVLSAFLARTVTLIQVDVPSCDPMQGQTIDLPAAALGILP